MKYKRLRSKKVLHLRCLDTKIHHHSINGSMLISYFAQSTVQDERLCAIFSKISDFISNLQKQNNSKKKD